MIAYIIQQHWTGEALLDDGSWSELEQYADRIEVFSCFVKAQRRAAKYLNDGWGVSVCPWEIEPPPLPEADSADAPEPRQPHSSNGPATASGQTSFAASW